MRKDIAKDLDKLEVLYNKYKAQFDKLDKKINEITDFEGGITYCAGDGHLVINTETSDVAFLSCLFGKSKSNKLTEETHLDYCI